MKALRCVSVLTLFLTCSGTYSAHRYFVIPFPGKAAALNNLNQVVGELADTNGLARPCIWTNGVAVDLTGLISTNGQSFSFGSATDINDRGEIVGNAFIDERRVAWRLQGKQLTVFDILDRSVSLQAINENGTILGSIGRRNDPDFVPIGTIFSPELELLDFGKEPPLYSATAIALNNRGEVLGNGFGSLGNAAYSYIFSLDQGTMPITIVTNLIAGNFNDIGEICGSTWAFAAFWPAVWNEGKSVILPADSSAGGFGKVINNNGQIVGNVNSTGGLFYWEKGLGLSLASLLLNPDAFNVDDPNDVEAINDLGTILLTSVGGARSYLLQPKDEVAVPSLQLVLSNEPSAFESDVSISWALSNPQRYKSLRAISFPVRTVGSPPPTRLEQSLSLSTIDAVLTNVPPGPNAVFLELTDADDRRWITAPRFFTVLQRPIQIGARERLNGNFEIVLAAQPEAVYGIEVSSNLNTWKRTTNFLESASRVYNLPVQNEREFFRFVKVAESGGSSSETPMLNAPSPGGLIFFLPSSTGEAQKHFAFFSDVDGYFGTLATPLNFTHEEAGPRSLITGTFTGPPDYVTRPFRLELDYDHQLDPLLGGFRGYFRARIGTTNGIEITSGSFTTRRLWTLAAPKSTRRAP